MKSDTKIEKSKIANIYSSDFFKKISLLKMHSLTSVNSETYAQLIICISTKRVLFLFIFVWVVVG